MTNTLTQEDESKIWDYYHGDNEIYDTKTKQMMRSQWRVDNEFCDSSRK